MRRQRSFDIAARVPAPDAGHVPAHCELRPTPLGARRCGGFGKGNFSELFRAIEEYETKSGINKI